jgi:hypothetical protein
VSNNNPASILYDQNGNAVGVVLDTDGNYRLQVEADTGNRTMLATSDALLLGAVNSLLKEARKIRKHLELINDDTGDDITGDNE